MIIRQPWQDTRVTNDKLLRIYLNDHLAASMGGLELARRALANNRDTHFAEVLERLSSEIEEDRDVLKDLIDRVGGSPDRLKEGAAWAAEKVGRLKPNGQVTGYSPLSRLLEFEGLSIGIEAKLSMWRGVRHVAETDRRLDQQRLDELIAKAERQREQMERLRIDAATLAFSPDAAGSEIRNA